ncbi:MAG: TonB-dependent receptor, partial [Gemmatimonadota bacterium]|nr:TonB-dependent receptor [Gemmatimonadota bacterium]
AYTSRLDDELLSLRDATGAPLGTSNAGATVHHGVELGASAPLTGRIAARLAYTYQDFRFDDDPVYGDNRLAGTAPHTYEAALRVALTGDLRTEAVVRGQAGRMPVDNANTLFRPSFTLLDLRALYRVTERIALHADARNLFDRTYAASTLTTDLARSDQAAFLPGDGRSLVIGITSSF